MKKGQVLFAVSIAVLIISFLPTHWFLPKWSNSAGSYDLAPNNINGPTLGLFYGSLVELDVSISGANNDVFFYITDSSGRRILDAGRIYDGYHLEWNAPAIGSFRLNFDNTMSTFSHKYVNWSFEVFHYGALLFFVGIGLLIVGILQIVREEKIISRIKRFLVKEPETLVVECEYCGETYSKTLDKCPHCSARKKATRASKKKK